MKRLGIALALWALLCGQAGAQLAGGLIFPGPGGVSGTVGPPVLTFVSLVVAGSSGSTTTTSSANIGTTAGFASRRIIVSASAVSGFCNGTLSSATINGVSATIVDQITLGAGPFATIFSALVPSGTTGITITLTFTSSTFAPTALAIYSVDDALMVSNTPTGFSKQSASAATSVTTASFSQTANGFIVTASSLSTGGTGFAVTGQTTDAFGGTNANIASHLGSISSTGSAAVTSTWTGSLNAAIIAAAWR